MREPFETEHTNTYKRSVRNMELLLKNFKSKLSKADVLVLEESIFVLKLQPQYEPTLLVKH